MAVLSLHWYARAFSGCGEWGLLFIVLRRLLIVAAALVEQGFRTQGQWLWRMGLVVLRHWGSYQIRDWTRVPCIDGWFLTTGPPGKPPALFLIPPNWKPNELWISSQKEWSINIYNNMDESPELYATVNYIVLIAFTRNPRKRQNFSDSRPVVSQGCDPGEINNKDAGKKLFRMEELFDSWIFVVLMVAQMVKNLPAMQETRVPSLGWEDPWRQEWQPTPVFLSGKFHGHRSLAGYSPWGHTVRHN